MEAKLSSRRQHISRSICQTLSYTSQVVSLGVSGLCGEVLRVLSMHSTLSSGCQSFSSCSHIGCGFPGRLCLFVHRTSVVSVLAPMETVLLLATPDWLLLAS
ncbi:hypothetical protein Tco_1014586 [Tanacetum coccineum]